MADVVSEEVDSRGKVMRSEKKRLVIFKEERIRFVFDELLPKWPQKP